MTVMRKTEPKAKAPSHEELANALQSLLTHAESTGGRDLPVVAAAKSLIERLKD